MKVKILGDEWYPVYSFSIYGEEAEVEKGKVAKWKRVFAEFARVQKEMEAALHAAQCGKKEATK